MLRTALLITTASLTLVLPAAADTKTYDMDSFNALDVSAGVTVIFEAGETQSITAENNTGDFDKLIVENKGDTLVVSRERSGWFSRNKRHNYTVRITAPAVTAVEASSGSDVTASGVIGASVDLRSSSGARLVANNVQAEKISLQASSGSDLDAAGTCTSADLSTSSGASVDADALICTSVSASASSGANLHAHATSKAYGRASSGANIRIIGGASDVEREKSSGGTVSIN